MQKINAVKVFYANGLFYTEKVKKINAEKISVKKNKCHKSFLCE